METESISLKGFLLGDPPNKALAESAAAAASVLKAGSDIHELDWRDLSADIAQELERMFDIRLTDVLASAWKDYQELSKCADPTKHSANEMISLPMIDHRIETVLRPCLDVIIGKRPAIRIPFEITCELEFTGLVLKIQDATIRAISVGSCRAKGSVKCGGITLIRRESKKLDLPGRIILAHGISLQPLRVTTPRKSENPKKGSTITTGASNVTDADLSAKLPSMAA